LPHRNVLVSYHPRTIKEHMVIIFYYSNLTKKNGLPRSVTINGDFSFQPKLAYTSHHEVVTQSLTQALYSQ
jgi:hypothetical protein